jgi:hypothetical protein
MCDDDYIKNNGQWHVLCAGEGFYNNKQISIIF